MRRWELESLLQHIQGFENSDAALEQYMTSPEIAMSTISLMMQQHNDDSPIPLLADFGCGTGMLSITAALENATHFILAIDIDSDQALPIAQKNVNTVLKDNSIVDFIHADVSTMQCLRPEVIDTVVMNPPFGTKRHGIDVAFLTAALNIAKSSVYSMHKFTTRSFLQKKFSTWKIPANVVAEVQFDIGRTLHFHKFQSVDIAVDVWHADTSQKSPNTLIETANVSELMNSKEIGYHNDRNRRTKGMYRGRGRSRGRTRGRGRGR